MTLHWLDDTVTIRRNTYSGNKSTLATVFTNVLSSIQNDEVELGVTDTGYASSSHTVFMGDERTIRINDRLITSGGKQLRVLGVKVVTSGSEDYIQLACQEEIDA